MLTPRQHELLTFIDGYIRQRGSAPDFREMADALGLKSNTGVDRMLKALEERGFVRRLRRRARAIEVVRLPVTKSDITIDAIAAIKLRKQAREAGLLEGSELWAAADKAEDAVLAKLEAANG